MYTSSCLAPRARLHTEECHASGNVWAPSTVWWMRRVWRNVIGTGTLGSALMFLPFSTLCFNTHLAANSAKRAYIHVRSVSFCRRRHSYRDLKEDVHVDLEVNSSQSADISSALLSRPVIKQRHGVARATTGRGLSSAVFFDTSDNTDFTRTSFMHTWVVINCEHSSQR